MKNPILFHVKIMDNFSLKLRQFFCVTKKKQIKKNNLHLLESLLKCLKKCWKTQTTFVCKKIRLKMFVYVQEALEIFSVQLNNTKSVLWTLQSQLFLKVVPIARTRLIICIRYLDMILVNKLISLNLTKSNFKLTVPQSMKMA